MQQHELNGALAIEMPIDAKNFEIVTNQSVIPYGKTLNYEDKPFRGYRNYRGIDLPQGNWQFLSLSSDMTEEQSAQIVEKSKGWFDRYKNYENDKLEFWSALESLCSWERSVGLVTVNPYGTKRPSLNDYETSNASQDYMDGLQNGNRFKSTDVGQAQQQVVNIAYLIKG